MQQRQQVHILLLPPRDHALHKITIHSTRIYAATPAYSER